MAGAIVLLLAGTQLLEWYWVVLLAVASFGVGVYRLRKNVPSTYKIAQRLDRRLALADALSTAAYFSTPGTHADEAVCERQRRDAESIARTVDVRAGVPFAAPRFAIPALALAAVAFGLFAVRYAWTGSMSLQPSLVKMAFDTFFPYKPEAAKNRRPNDPRKGSQPDQGEPDTTTAQNQDTPETMLDAEDSPAEVNADSVDNSKSASKQGSQSDAPDQQAQNGDKSDKSTAGNDPQDNASQSDSKDGKQQNGKEAKQGNGSNNENSSLMDKLRDAMANVLNKMSSSPKDGQQPSQNSQNGQSGPKDQSNQKGKPSPNKSDPSADAQADQQSDGSDKSQSADARGQEKGSDKNASNDSKSGIGSADGDKSGKEAEELAAMGKISEILGKRSANVSGEVMVEVGSTKQQLKTPWAQRQATHSEAGSEIHRDEVPLIYQPFVEQYFEEIRKPAPAAKTPSKPADKSQNPG